jgi:hypothetical protein
MSRTRGSRGPVALILASGKRAITSQTKHTSRAYGAYLVSTGGWPLLDRRSFEAVTGPKADFWLARCIGGLSIAIGVALLRSPRRDLLCGAAATFAATDVYAARNASRAYLLDSVVQAAALATASRQASA